MKSSLEINNYINKLDKGIDSHLSQLDSIIAESKRVEEVAHNAPELINNLDEEFQSITKFNKIDIEFLFFATALQCTRQYFLSDFKERLNDKDAAKKTLGKKKFDPHDLEARKEAGFAIRHHKLYAPSLEEIILHPVPFDTTKGCKEFDELNPFINTGYLGHRAGAIGHDPILGWLFGTANIATSTLTGWNMNSFHIFSKTGIGGGDFLKYNARTDKVLSYTWHKLLNEGLKGKTIVATSLIKEGVHLSSDVYSKKSLPFPIISVIDPQIASELALYGVDMGNIKTIGKQASLSIAINMIIGMIHRMIYSPEKDCNKDLYQVKTRKIILYSNLIASTSNVLAVEIAHSIGAITGNAKLMEKSLKKLDIGGLLVTVDRLIKDTSFINKMKQEFIINNFNKMIEGDL